MSDQQTIERIQQEVHTANQSTAHEKENQESSNSFLLLQQPTPNTSSSALII